MQRYPILFFYLFLSSCSLKQADKENTTQKDSIIFTKDTLDGFRAADIKTRIEYKPVIKNSPFSLFDSSYVWMCYDSLDRSYTNKIPFSDANFERTNRCDCNEEVYKKVYLKSHELYTYIPIQIKKKATLRKINHNDFILSIPNQKDQLFRFYYDSIVRIDSNYVEDISSATMSLTVVRCYKVEKIR